MEEPTEFGVTFIFLPFTCTVDKAYERQAKMNILAGLGWTL